MFYESCLSVEHPNPGNQKGFKSINVWLSAKKKRKIHNYKAENKTVMFRPAHLIKWISELFPMSSGQVMETQSDFNLEPTNKTGSHLN